MRILSQFSGGFDSVASTLKLLQEGHEVYGMFFNLGQKYVAQEADAAEFANKYLSNAFPDTWGGYYTEKVTMELAAPAEDGTPSAYIPVRNFVFASHSANVAIANGFEAIAVGSKTLEVRPDDPYSFSDCSREFYDKCQDIVNFCSEGDTKIEFLMPLVIELETDPVRLTSMSKGDVMQMLIDQGIPLDKLWSCYEDVDKPCGVCYHCIEVKKAFDEINHDYTDYFTE